MPALGSVTMRTYNCSVCFTYSRRVALKVTYRGFDSLSETLAYRSVEATLKLFLKQWPCYISMLYIFVSLFTFVDVYQISDCNKPHAQPSDKLRRKLHWFIVSIYVYSNMTSLYLLSNDRS